MPAISWGVAAIHLAGLIAVAADQPPMAPTRPVSVTYRLVAPDSANAPGKVSITYDKDANRVRLAFYGSVAAASPTGTLIFDSKLGRVISFPSGSRTYVQRDTAGLANPGVFLGPDLTYTRIRTESFAGLTCTVWAVETSRQSASACVTDDGVVLRASRGGAHPGQMDAIAVAYGPPPADAFAIPEGYTRIDTAPKP